MAAEKAGPTCSLSLDDNFEQYALSRTAIDRPSKKEDLEHMRNEATEVPKPTLSRRDALKGLTGLAAITALSNEANAETTQSKTTLRSPTHATATVTDAREQSFNSDWRFDRADTPGAEQPGFDDLHWRSLDVPHDWSIEDLGDPESSGLGALWTSGDTPTRVGPFDMSQSAGQGATGWMVGGTGWYRKRFSVAALPAGSNVGIRFDGVYMDSDVWINGRHLGNHPYGYTTFAYDLTPYLKRDSENVLAVRVRNEGRTSRWYSGSGIFRDVWLTVTGEVHVPLWGVSITTPEVSSDTAVIRVETHAANMSTAAKDVLYRVQLYGSNQSKVAASATTHSLPASATLPFVEALTVKNPDLWSPKDPKLYRAEIELEIEGKVIDRVSTYFGIRRVEVDAEHGLRINGEAVKLRGGCLHHDNGVLGSAAIARAGERRVELMKANGFNAIRTSHNPPSPAFLDACDRLGILVIDESFDCWEIAKNPEDYHRFFDEWWKRDIESMVLRDRNHPSVIIWSIGNEINERAEPKGVEIGTQLREHIRRLDPTRPVTAAICGFWDRPGKTWAATDPAFSYLDIGGYNYEWRQYETDHVRFPNRIMMGTESFPNQAFENWEAIERLSYVIGDFVWTGMDYLGESGIGSSALREATKASAPSIGAPSFPWFNAYCGDVDLIGGKKPQSYYRDVVWGRSKLEMAVQRPLPLRMAEEISLWGWSDELRSWTWPDSLGRPLKVRVYTTGDQVRLLVNGKEVGTQEVSRKTKLTAEFDVPFAPGELRAIALDKGREIASLSFKTAGKINAIRMKVDRQTIHAKRSDLAYVTVEVVDEAGIQVPDAAVPITFSVRGAGELAGVGNANPKDAASFREPQRQTYQGRCLAVLRPVGGPGTITLRAETIGLPPATLVVKTQS